MVIEVREIRKVDKKRVRESKITNLSTQVFITMSINEIIHLQHI